MTFKVITLYKFEKIENPESIRDKIKEFAKERGILGRILLGEEGINAGVSGTEQSIPEFKKFVESFFGELTYRELDSGFNPYNKLQVKVRKEIVAFGVKVDTKKTCNYLEPKQAKELMDKKEAIVIDTRNTYEAEIGKFKDAIIPPIETFKEFPAWIKKQEDLKDKKIIIYCTGGIRCEKAGAYMKDLGFKDVNQIKGGVINYCQQYPNTHWEGSLFVFDNRLTADMKSEKATAKCVQCEKETQHSTNCANVECNKIYPCCKECLEKLNNCCCIDCMKAERHREMPNVFAR